MAIKPKTALLIVNSNSHSGSNAISTVLEHLRTVGIDAMVETVSSPKLLSNVIRDKGREAELIVVGGGDGTLNAAADGIAAIDRPLGIIPLGTANDLARTLGIPENIEQAVDIIAEGYTRPIDVGAVNGKMFFNVASVGMSADLCRELTTETKRRFGRLGYAIAAIRVVARARPFRATIRSGTDLWKSTTLQIAIGNGKYYGGGNIVEADAVIDDRTLRLYSLEFVKAWKIILNFRSFRMGEHGVLNEVRTLRAETFELITRKPRPVNADGELVTSTPAVFEVIPQAIRVFVQRP